MFSLNLFDFCQTIRSNTNKYSYKLFRNRIKLKKNLCNWYNHRVFILQCLRENVSPKYLLIKSLDKSIRFVKAVVTAARTF